MISVGVRPYMSVLSHRYWCRRYLFTFQFNLQHLPIAYLSSFFKVESAPNRINQPKQHHRTIPVEPSKPFTKYYRQRISEYLRAMANPDIENELAPLRAAVKESGDLVNSLKQSNANKLDIDRAIAELKLRKRRLEETELSLAPKEAAFDRGKLEDLLKRRFFYDQSFAIYGGVTGLYDFGPMGCAMKANMLQVWRKHFVLEENMLEVDCSVLTPEAVLKASGHVERFADWMVKDTVTGECFRADHLIKNQSEKLLEDAKLDRKTRDKLVDVLAKLDGFSNIEMKATIDEFKFKSPTTGNALTDPIAFNLMFPTKIGPTGELHGYLRPETAQGIFVNFKRLLEFNQGRLPFAAAQIGAGFRNEISPRQGLIRVREFTMCEIEHFVDPNDKNHHKFGRVKDYQVLFFSACNQLAGKPAEWIAVGKAVEDGIVANETLGYYIARVHQYMLRVGVDPKRLRFRQHLANEMAHYAKDCWDAECLTSYGWIECVGNADRACYDLDQHFKATGVKLTAEKHLAQPKKVDVVEAVADKRLLGQQFKKEAKLLTTHLECLDTNQVLALEQQLTANGKYLITIEGNEYALTSDMVQVKRYTKEVHVEEITPSVIEPSFGIGRIMYTVLEHSFRYREGDEQRRFLSLCPLIAPIKCSVLPLMTKPEFVPIIERVVDALLQHELSYRIDDTSVSIGRRYARTDEIGIPFGVTVDFDSLHDPVTVTLRDAFTMEQVRLPVSTDYFRRGAYYLPIWFLAKLAYFVLQLSELGSTVRQMVDGHANWSDILAKYPRVTQDPNAAQ